MELSSRKEVADIALNIWIDLNIQLRILVEKQKFLTFQYECYCRDFCDMDDLEFKKYREYRKIWKSIPIKLNIFTVVTGNFK